ncbi:hypothetical protein [Bradyrhizobium sp. CCBAU 25338]|uniref:hypothetical protein n=1 Tax=Bradyrhizobium sp. CCBAU 25338 TaxID=1641877 RepID=UPI0023048221|nr:hypothetical protein [Bradyrhizobium sp. CCBAU 25338]MDA9533149.1 hypothetical protein [Bradyrhizobium sp. CCBAU 25338]
MAAYSKGYKRFKLDRPLSITLTRASILRAAGLGPAQSRQTRNRRELQGALQRLTEPVVKGLPPLVRSIKTMRSGRLRLIIEPKWLPDGNYGQLVWPPPKSGATVLALYLFLGGCRLRSRIDPMAVERLYRRIGIHHLRPSHAERALDHALVVINEHLKLTDADLEERDFPQGVKVKRFENGNRIRFSAVLSTKQKENRRIKIELNKYRPQKEEIDQNRREEEEAERWYDEHDRKRKRRQAREREDYEENGYYDTV